MKKYIALTILTYILHFHTGAQTINPQTGATNTISPINAGSFIQGLQFPRKNTIWANSKWQLGNAWFDSAGYRKIFYWDGLVNRVVADTAWVDSVIKAGGSVAGVASFNTRTGAVTLQYSDVTTALTYTPENVANKATNFATLNNTLYPTTAAVNTYLNTNLAGYFAKMDSNTNKNPITLSYFNANIPSLANYYTKGKVDSNIHDSITSNAVNYLKTTDSSSRYGTSNNIVARDANGNTHANNFESAFIQIGASGTKVLTNASERQQYFANGTGTVTCILPNATTMSNGHVFELNQNGTGTLTVKNAGSTTLFTVPSGGYAYVILTNNSTSNGTWDWHFELPKTAQFGTLGLSMTGNITADTFNGKLALSNIYPAPTTGTVTSITAGTGLSGGIITTSGTISMPSVGTAATYTYPSAITTDAQGRVSSVTSGSAPTGGTVTNVIGGTNISITGTSTIQPTVNISGTIAMANGGTGTTLTTSVNGTPITYGSNNTLPIGTGTVTSVATNTSTGVTGGTITTSGTISLDTNMITTHAWRQKAVDSLNTLIAAKGTGSVTSVATGNGLSGGTITTSGTLTADTGILCTKNYRQKAVDSLNGVIATKGTVSSVATNTGTGITGGTITTSGTIAADTLLLSTRKWRQKAVDSIIGIGYITSNQTITLSGDVTGSGTTSITTTLATVNATPATYGSGTAIPVITVDSKGRATTITTVNPSVTTTNTATLTNKRWTARVTSQTTVSATPSINTDNQDIWKVTAQAVDITNMSTNLTGTPVDGDILEIQITGTAARAITWGTSFASSTVTLPTTTTTTATLTVIFQYYTNSSYGNNKWICASTW